MNGIWDMNWFTRRKIKKILQIEATAASASIKADPVLIPKDNATVVMRLLERRKAWQRELGSCEKYVCNQRFTIRFSADGGRDESVNRNFT